MFSEKNSGHKDVIKTVRAMLGATGMNELTDSYLSNIKMAWQFLSKKSLFWKIFEGEMSIRT